jgi:hypothetical protein
MGCQKLTYQITETTSLKVVYRARKVAQRLLRIDPAMSMYPSMSPYSYVGGNPIRFVDPTGANLDDIFLDENGNETGRITNSDPDRFFTEHESGSYGYKGKNYIQVNSKESITGDKKEGTKAKWNGQIKAVTSEEGKTMVESGVNAANSSATKVTGTVGESMQGGKMDYQGNFKDGTLYNINGIHYNAHEALNYYWGAAMNQLGWSPTHTMGGAIGYHGLKYGQSIFTGNSYSKAGPREEAGHGKAQGTGYFNYGVPNRGTQVTETFLFIGATINYQLFNNNFQTRPIGQ